jgi:hypothetical protein
VAAIWERRKSKGSRVCESYGIINGSKEECEGFVGDEGRVGFLVGDKESVKKEE